MGGRCPGARRLRGPRETGREKKKEKNLNVNRKRKRFRKKIVKRERERERERERRKKLFKYSDVRAPSIGLIPKDLELAEYIKY